MEDNLVQIETLVIELLLIVSLVAIGVQYLRVPYTVALVGVGLLIGLAQPLVAELTGPIQLDLTPELILALFVPPLIFEAAFNLDVEQLRRNLPAVLLMAVPGVVVTMFIVGGIVAATTTLALPVALVFGALIAATDPVAVVAMFRSLGVPRRLAVLVEGESLLNDGTAIVIFNVVLAVAVTGQFSIGQSIMDFVRVVIGGLVIGLGLGAVIQAIIARVDNHLIETTLTTVLAFGAYLLAERFHFSGVLAVVAAGLLNGNLGGQGMSPTTRIILDNFWEYVAFLANSLLFFLIGLELDAAALLEHGPSILVAIIAVLIARVLVVYVFSWMVNRSGEPIPMRWQHVLAWGGLRGAISLALVLSLPTALGGDRAVLTTLTFGVVLFTLFVQGTTIGPLLRWLGVVNTSELHQEYETSRARLITLQNSEKHMQGLRQRGAISSYAWERIQPDLHQETEAATDKLRSLLEDYPELAELELRTARAEMLRSQRSVLLDLRRNGVISEEVFEQMAVSIDELLEDLQA
ncbi:MAG: Na+/H+ antiporter [Anaerolineae bacterium]|nr:Na+/H+ antiporter [Anaerolineae bacterium]